MANTDELVEAFTTFSEELDLGVTILDGDSGVEDEYVSLETGAIKLANENCPNNEAGVTFGNEDVNNKGDDLSLDDEFDNNKEETDGTFS